MAAYCACHVQVKTSAAVMMLLSIIGCKEQLAEAAESGVDTVVLEQMLQTINSWSVLKRDASPERSQPSQTSDKAPAAQPQANSCEVATTLPFVAAARVLETLVFWHRRSTQPDEPTRWRVQFNRGMLIACFALSTCSRQTLQKVAQPDEEASHKADYSSCLPQTPSEEGRAFPWVEQCRVHIGVDYTKRAEVIGMVATTQLLQLSIKLQNCQVLAEEWFASTQGNAFKLFVEMFHNSITMQPSSVQHSQAERDAFVR